MNENAKRDRSPNYPKLTLEAAIAVVQKLHKEIGKAKVSRDVAMGALGYSGSSGASLTTLGALNQYGLLEQDRGTGISISPLAISILHPLNDEQARTAKAKSALMPKVFNELYSCGLSQASESTLANHLIQSDFTPDGARKAASVYLENYSFSNLSDASIIPEIEDKKEAIVSEKASGKDAVKPMASHPEGKANVAATLTVSSVRNLTFPLPSGATAILTIPCSLRESDFESFVAALNSSKEGIVTDYPTVDCQAIDWQKRAESLAESNMEFNLINFDFTFHSAEVRKITKDHNLNFRFFPNNGTGFVRKRSPSTTA